MDFTQHAAYFQGAQQFPQHFMGMHGTPLTPSHSNSAGSDDFNTTSPPVGPPGLVARASDISPSQKEEKMRGPEASAHIYI